MPREKGSRESNATRTVVCISLKVTSVVKKLQHAELGAGTIHELDLSACRTTRMRGKENGRQQRASCCRSRHTTSGSQGKKKGKTRNEHAWDARSKASGSRWVHR
ncbi:uncharacterized protein K489DRAFT_234289 [Dissoconium aciculare CBS 342.82]|uniref:Uncharacterized protein n=1 Tax=Dissoconium aciculare CBS 342.82 TaxID=1314786 RepID=A0A6J3M2B6_9PEZI|nr:uncharacterized protein K489DRAFT_234289 [Dissoconium aciculare CBS 342.82]KAF1822151.1 hypothetical protein K489DRAFT_234289 [Dissoconium aciculare CBS 342.82]